MDDVQYERSLLLRHRASMLRQAGGVKLFAAANSLSEPYTEA